MCHWLDGHVSYTLISPTLSLPKHLPYVRVCILKLTRMYVVGLGGGAILGGGES